MCANMHLFLSVVLSRTNKIMKINFNITMITYMNINININMNMNMN